MPKILLTVTLFLLAATARAEGGLTEQETRWLRAAAPVLAYSQQLKLPIDIIVQPKARPNDVPMAMGFEGGRCKLVLSMRGNPDAEAILENVPVKERSMLIEAMAAHEVGHCWRYAQGVWHKMPAGFVEVGEEHAADATLLEESKAMRENRREEGFADLVALAWTWRHHRADYGRVYTWMAGLRAHQPVPGSTHDTRAWVRLARDGSVFQDTANPFDGVGAAWQQGLVGEEQ
jgi:hypothetical protein